MILHYFRLNIPIGNSKIIPIPDTAKILGLRADKYTDDLLVLYDEDHTIAGGRRVYCFASDTPLPGNLHSLKYVGTIEPDFNPASHYFIEED